ncbi:MAG: peptide chain release factor N(5)-glutamine methyltransferase [Prolixibacteraceae bacterium]|nr:peptide chain release factor N(5)-glutamine methyltransferase [Prolixibacteraceae bacterium]
MQQAIDHIRKSLKGFYGQQEIESFIYLIFEHLFQIGRKEVILNDLPQLKDCDLEKVKNIVARLRNFEPIQYILGETEFYNLPFEVKPGVLIPRSETEELVDHLVKEYKEKIPKILDIGTGSGCIAIALKKFIPNAEVWATDISQAALEIAESNARKNGVNVRFFLSDILSEKEITTARFDVIVSNPPYITEKEKALMEKNVLEHEPHEALFVPDYDPLRFYRAILNHSTDLLNEKGKLYFEINEAYGKEVQELCINSGFEALVMKDLNGKDRFVHVRKTSILK